MEYDKRVLLHTAGLREDVNDFLSNRAEAVGGRENPPKSFFHLPLGGGKFLKDTPRVASPVVGYKKLIAPRPGSLPFVSPPPEYKS